MCRFSSLRATACLVCIYPWGFTLYTAGNSFKSLNFDFLSLIGVSDSEVFIVLILIYFSLFIHVKTSATWGGGRSPPHQSRTAYYLKKKCLTWTRRRIPKDLVWKVQNTNKIPIKYKYLFFSSTFLWSLSSYGWSGLGTDTSKNYFR